MDQLNLHQGNGLELHSMDPMERMMVLLEVCDILTVKQSMVSRLRKLCFDGLILIPVTRQKKPARHGVDKRKKTGADR